MKIKSVIETYNLFSQGATIYVGLSGGKDSAATCFLLKELQYNVVPLIVDMNDPGFDALSIKDKIDARGFDARILDVYSPNFLRDLPLNSKKKVQTWLEFLKDVPSEQTACTYCYNTKIVAFSDFISKEGGRTLVIGQHRDDMITSLLKCYWTDRYFHEITEITGQNYNGKLMKEFINRNKIDIDYINSLVTRGLAATDDPIREQPTEKLEIVRPLAKVTEKEICNYTIGLNYQTSDSDTTCRYRRREPRPFRLLVQHDLEKRLSKNPKLGEILFELVLKGFNKDGALKFRPRNLREKYYPDFKEPMTKL